MPSNQATEDLRQRLLDEIWAGACSGLGPMLLDEAAILRAGPEELEAMACRYGIK